MDEKIVKISVSFVIVAILFSVMMPIIATNSDSIACRNTKINIASTDITTYVNGSIAVDETAGFWYNSSDYTNTTIRLIFMVPNSTDGDLSRQMGIRMYTNTTSYVANFSIWGADPTWINVWFIRDIDNESLYFDFYYVIVTTNTTYLSFDAYYVERLCNVTDLLPIQTMYTVLLPLIVLIGSVIAIVVYKKEN